MLSAAIAVKCCGTIEESIFKLRSLAAKYHSLIAVASAVKCCGDIMTLDVFTLQCASDLALLKAVQCCATTKDYKMWN